MFPQQERGRREKNARCRSPAVDSAVIGISISICPSASEQSCEASSLGDFLYRKGCICLLELACSCQAIVVMCLSPGSCLQAQGPSVTWTAVGFTSKSSGHYSLEMGPIGRLYGSRGRNHWKPTLPCVTFVGQHSCRWNNRD